MTNTLYPLYIYAYSIDPKYYHLRHVIYQMLIILLHRFAFHFG